MGFDPILLEADKTLLQISFEVLNYRTRIPAGSAVLKLCDPLVGRQVYTVSISILMFTVAQFCGPEKGHPPTSTSVSR